VVSRCEAPRSFRIFSSIRLRRGSCACPARAPAHGKLRRRKLTFRLDRLARPAALFVGAALRYLRAPQPPRRKKTILRVPAGRATAPAEAIRCTRLRTDTASVRWYKLVTAEFACFWRVWFSRLWFIPVPPAGATGMATESTGTQLQLLRRARDSAPQNSQLCTMSGDSQSAPQLTTKQGPPARS
jgi:hypothetical protein